MNVMENEKNAYKVRASPIVYKVLLLVVYIFSLNMTYNRFYDSSVDLFIFIISAFSIFGLILPVNSVKYIAGYSLSIVGGILITVGAILAFISIVNLFYGYYTIIFMVAIIVIGYGTLICLTGMLILNEVITIKLNMIKLKK